MFNERALDVLGYAILLGCTTKSERRNLFGPGVRGEPQLFALGT
jgi:hypothetical protein